MMLDRSLRNGAEGTALFAYGIMADEVRLLAARILERMYLLQERYPSAELREAIKSLAEWQHGLDPGVMTTVGSRISGSAGGVSTAGESHRAKTFQVSG